MRGRKRDPARLSLEVTWAIVNRLTASEKPPEIESCPTAEEMEEVLPADSFSRLPIPLEAASLAGKAFLRYRRRQRAKISLLPDFFIGAHAAVEGLRLLTRGSRRYRTYFPSIGIIAPTRK